MQTYSVACFQLRALTQALTALGLDVPRLAASAGVDLARASDPDARFPELTLLQLWTAAERAYPGDLLGVRAGEAVPFGALEIVDYLLGASASVADAFEGIARFAELCDSGVRYAIEPRTHDDGGQGVAVIMHHPYGFELWPTSCVEYLWTLMRSRLRLRLGESVRPTLRLGHAPAGPLPVYRRALGHVVFGCARSELVFSAEDWTRPNPGADAALAALLARYATQLIERLPRSGDPLELTRSALTTRLRAGEPTLERVAADLGMTGRTLQRRLVDRGSSFKELLDDVRRELACAYLKRSSVSLSEVAYLLGYSDASAFNRAFRRWADMTPAEYRKSPDAARPLAVVQAPQALDGATR